MEALHSLYNTGCLTTLLIYLLVNGATFMAAIRHDSPPFSPPFTSYSANIDDINFCMHARLCMHNLFLYTYAFVVQIMLTVSNQTLIGYYIVVILRDFLSKSLNVFNVLLLLSYSFDFRLHNLRYPNGF